MSRTNRKGSKMNNFKEVKDGSRTRCDKSCENNGGCPWCLRNRQHNLIKNKLTKREIEDLIWNEEND